MRTYLATMDCNLFLSQRSTCNSSADYFQSSDESLIVETSVSKMTLEMESDYALLY